MRGKTLVKLCGVLALLAAASAVTFFTVRTLVPAPGPASNPWATYVATGSGGWSSDWEKRWRYTQEDLSAALALQTEGYQDRSVEAFAKALADWADEDAFHRTEKAMERLGRTYARDGDDAAFILRTLNASMGEAATRHYGGYCTALTDQFYDGASRQRYEDVFGDPYLVFEAEADYNLNYKIEDAAKLTVGERDRVLDAYRDSVQAFLDGMTEAQLSDEEGMARKLRAELERLDKALSTPLLTLSGTSLDYYVAYGYQD